MGYPTTKWTKLKKFKYQLFYEMYIVVIANMIKLMDLKNKQRLKLLPKRYCIHTRHLLLCPINAIKATYVKH